MAGKNQAYAERYAEFAMEQMCLYGIPASVTLAQGILESASGQSRLAQNENNHFGIKATQSWIAGGGRYGLYTDDKPNEKFCSYDSVGDSYAHHSRFLKENSRYASCFKLDADDYRGWAQGLDKAGYATAGKYAPALISIIESNDLQRYDRMVMEEMNAKGLKPGQGTPQMQPDNANGTEQDYSFPLKREEFLFVTSPFGMRKDPTDPSKQQMHKGIDIRCDNEAVLATEKDGKVVAVNDNANTPGGKSVTVEYAREGGAKVQVSYLHLSSTSVKVGDTVNAGQQIGVSGNTGTRTTGSHLHLGVKQIASDGTGRRTEPVGKVQKLEPGQSRDRHVPFSGGMDEEAPVLRGQRYRYGRLRARPGNGNGDDAIHLPDGIGRADRQQDGRGTDGCGNSRRNGQAHRPYTACEGNEGVYAHGERR